MTVDGLASEADIVGALFGQTEGILEREMEFKQLQRTGRIGRISLKIKTSGGKTIGTIEIPSSLNKVETAILAATLEIVDRVGSYDASVKLNGIEDVRKEKKTKIVDRAKEIMQNWKEDPEIKNLKDTVLKSTLSTKKPITFGKEKLAAGNAIFENDEIILVEGRADVIKLLSCGIDNVIEVRGTNLPSSVRNLCKKKSVTVFLDGDGGGDQVLKQLLNQIEIDYIARAPPHSEVEDLSKADVRSLLERKIPAKDAKFLTFEKSVRDFLGDMNGSRRGTSSRGISRDRRRYSSNQRTDVKDDVKTTPDKKKSFLTRVKSKFDGKSEPKNKDEKPQSENKPRMSELKSKSKKTNRYSEPRRSGNRRRFDKRPGQGFDKRSKFSRGSGRRGGRERRPPVPEFEIPRELLGALREIQHSTSSTFFDSENRPFQTVSTADTYNYLTQTKRDISAILIDGVISSRLLSEAKNKHVKYLLGAVVSDEIPEYGSQTDSNGTIYTTFNYIKHSL